MINHSEPHLDLDDDPKGGSTFEQQSQMKPPGLVSEFIDFLIHNRRWWLTPIIVILLLMSVVIALTNTVIGPFIYALF
jgi:hypothetical protein